MIDPAHAEVTQAPLEAENSKRDAANGSPAAEEPPSKKPRVEGSQGSDEPENDRNDLRKRGIAPIKAE